MDLERSAAAKDASDRRVPARLETPGRRLGWGGGGFDVAKERQDVEESREHVAALGGGRDGFDTQRMDGEEQGGHGGAPAEGGGRGGGRQGEAEEAQRQEVEGQGGGGVEEEAREVIAGGCHAPEEIVEAEGEPGQGDVVAGVEGGEHPTELGPPEAAVVGIVEEVERVVPRRESVAECRQKSDECDERDEDGREPAASHPDWPRQPPSSGGEAPSSDAARRAF